LFRGHKTSLRDPQYRGHKIRPTLLVALAALINLAQGCATSPPPHQLPALPPPIDLGALIPPARGPLVLPAHVRRYPDRAVRAGQCAGLPPGILVSPAVYAEGIATATDRRRLAVEVAALGRARTAEREAAGRLEVACRVRVGELGQAVLAERALTGWKAGALLVAGGLVGFAVGFLAGRPIGR
jgi:hypothetical protein